VLRFDHRELVYDKPVIVGWVREIDQANVIASNRSIWSLVFHFDTITQHLVKGTIAPNERRCFQPQSFAQNVLLPFLRNQQVQQQPEDNARIKTTNRLRRSCKASAH
jgi:hypothetical protein